MDVIVWGIIGAVIGALPGVLLGYWWGRRGADAYRKAAETARQEVVGLQVRYEAEQRRREEAEQAGQLLETQLSTLQQQMTKFQVEAQRQASALKERFLEEKARLEADLRAQHRELELLRKQLRDQEKMLQQFEATARKEFENLANKLLEEKSEKFTRQNRTQLQQILDPLKEQLKDFRERIEKADKAQHGRMTALQEQLKHLHAAHQRLSDEALALTRALKGQSQTQGAWGEMILESILEHSGLVKDQEYVMQQSVVTDEGRRLRPDVIIHLPQGRKLVIDAKVSLVDYERYVNAADASERQQALQGFLRSVQQHIRGLKERNYQGLFQGKSPDFVLMFMPIEPAFSLALQKEPTLYHKAFKDRIVIVSPTTLLAVLRIVHSMWQNEKQQRHALEIAERAGRLYDKFVSFYNSLQEIGKRISQLDQAYGSAVKQLKEGRGNLIGQVEALKKLGAKANKQLPLSSDEELSADDVV